MLFKWSIKKLAYLIKLKKAKDRCMEYRLCKQKNCTTTDMKRIVNKENRMNGWANEK